MSLLNKMIKNHKKMKVQTKELTETRKNDRSTATWADLRDLKKLKLRAKDKINEVKSKLFA